MKYLVKINLIWLFDYRHEPNFATAPTTLYTSPFKSGQKCPKNNQLTYFANVKSKLLIHKEGIFLILILLETQAGKMHHQELRFRGFTLLSRCHNR